MIAAREFVLRTWGENGRGGCSLKAETDGEHAAAEQPVLWLGISGFAPDQRAALEAALVRPQALPRWRVSSLGEADAWWVNGAKVRLLRDGNLKIAPGLPTEHALQLNLGDVDRPVGFAAPLAPAEFEPLCVFDPQSDPSIKAVLLQFDNWLRPLRAQFVLGGQVIQRAVEARRGIFHVSHGGNLLAVLDFQEGRAAISPRAHPVDIADAHWDKRPIGARDMPESFVPTSLSQLAWSYVRRTDRDMLPPRYRSRPIYYCHAPAVPMRWLRDSHLLILRELSVEPGTVQELSQRTGLPARRVEHDLACLYYAGSISTTKGRAAQPAHARQDSQPFSLGAGMESLPASDLPAYRGDDLTAPARLERRPAPPPGSDSSSG